MTYHYNIYQNTGREFSDQIEMNRQIRCVALNTWRRTQRKGQNILEYLVFIVLPIDSEIAFGGKQGSQGIL